MFTVRDIRPRIHCSNRYFCQQCDSLQDAKRYTELRELPPVLHFSLLRFVYDVATMERKKSKQTIMFPTFIDMGSNFGGSSITEDSFIGQLRAADKKVSC